MSQENSDIPDEAKQAAEHLRKAKGAKAFGDDTTADANVRAAWIRLEEALEKEVEKTKKTSK